MYFVYFVKTKIRQKPGNNVVTIPAQSDKPMTLILSSALNNRFIIAAEKRSVKDNNDGKISEVCDETKKLVLFPAEIIAYSGISDFKDWHCRQFIEDNYKSGMDYLKFLTLVKNEVEKAFPAIDWDTLPSDTTGITLTKYQIEGGVCSIDSGDLIWQRAEEKVKTDRISKRSQNFAIAQGHNKTNVNTNNIIAARALGEQECIKSMASIFLQQQNQYIGTVVDVVRLDGTGSGTLYEAANCNELAG